MTYRSGLTIAGMIAAGWLTLGPAPARAEPDRVLGPQGPSVLIGSKSRGRKPPEPRDSDRHLMVVVNTPYQIFEDQGSYVHVAAWRPDGSPARRASVFVDDVEVGKTDRHGALVFVYPPPGSSKDSALGAGEITVVDGRRRGEVGFEPSLRTDSFASDHLFVYTDRGVYRPGETVRIRCLAWHLEQDYAPLANATVELTLTDGSGKVVGGGSRVTDELGVLALDIPLAEAATEGLYTLKVAYRAARESTRLQVRELAIPQLTIDHDLGRFITADQQTLGFGLTLNAPSGAAVDRAELVLSARADGTERLRFERRLTGPGPHRIELARDQLAGLTAGLSANSFVTLSLAARDQLGRTAELRRELRFTRNPYVAVLETDKDQYTTGDSVEIVAKVSDLDQVPLRNTPLTLTFGGRKITETTSDHGMAQFSLVMPDKSQPVELFAPGVKGSIARATLRWIEQRPMSSHIAAPIIRERGTARVKVVFPSHIVPAEKVVHMDVTDTSGAIVNAVLLPIRKRADGYVAEGSFRAPSWGSMLLTFFALGRDTREKDRSRQLGLLTEGQNLVVQPDRELVVTFDGLPKKAEPGDDLTFGVKVTDGRGKPVRAAVGLMAVDRRLLALKDPLEVTPMDQLYDPRLRTMSTTGSKILSWPVVSRNWGDRRHDVALPPFDYLEGGPGRVKRRRRAKNSKSKAKYGTIGHGSGTGSGYGVGAGKGTSKVKPGAGKSNPSTSGSRRPATPAPQGPRISIRTRFPETFLWKPSSIAESGRLRIRSRLPHAIGEQELIAVASDARGGVGLVRARIAVDQPLFAQAVLPDVLYAGETVQVPAVIHNSSGRRLEVEVGLRTLGSKSDPAQATVTVGDGSSAAVSFPVTASRPGKLRLELEASALGFRDVMLVETRVAPGGAPHSDITTGTASRTAPFVGELVIPETGTARASLTVAFPSVTSALLGTEALSKLVASDPSSLAADLQSAALVLQYARGHKLASRQLDRLQGAVNRAVSELVAAQNSDGSFSYWRSRKPSPHLTAWVLESLLAARQIGVQVPALTLRRANSWLAGQLVDDRITIDDISWWEGNSQAVALGLTAEVFDVLTQVPTTLLAPEASRAIERLASMLQSWLAADDLDPLTAGRAIQGLVRQKKLDRSAARAIIGRLTLARDRGHWEPSWFHAYGGRIEATVAMLEAMQLVDPGGFQAEKRDALNWILSTKEAWGQWHNERGTAQAIRALLLVGAPPDEVPGVVTVEVAGRVVQSVKIDPADPFLSALRLSQIDIGRKLGPGRYPVRVRYDGKLAPAVMMRVDTYRPAGAAADQQGSARVWSAAPPRVRTGQPVDLRIEVDRSPGDMASVLITPSNLVEVDLPQLDRHIAGNPTATRYRITPAGVRIDLAPGSRRAAIAVPMKADGPGSGNWPSIGVVVDGKTLRTNPGALRVD